MQETTSLGTQVHSHRFTRAGKVDSVTHHGVTANCHMGIKKLARMFKHLGVIDAINTVSLNTPHASHVNDSKK